MSVSFEFIKIWVDRVSELVSGGKVIGSSWLDLMEWDVFMKVETLFLPNKVMLVRSLIPIRRFHLALVIRIDYLEILGAWIVALIYLNILFRAWIVAQVDLSLLFTAWVRSVFIRKFSFHSGVYVTTEIIIFRMVTLIFRPLLEVVFILNLS